MRVILIFIITIFPLSLFSQSFSESDIKNLAEEVNQEIKGVNIGNGIRAKGCFALGRTLIYQYEVPEYWQAPKNLKAELISNLKTAGAAKTYFLYNINVNFYYFRSNSLIEKVSIKSNELSTFKFELGEYISLNKHPKAKEVNIKLKAPTGWEIKEGARPNIVKKFVKEGNTYLVLVKENMTFFSRNESKELLQDEDFTKEFIEGSSSFFTNPKILSQRIITLDTYPTLEFKVKGTMERTGLEMEMIMKSWVIFYEDKLIFLQSMGLDNAEFKVLEQLYFLITNSVIFPDQYY
ncbi:hypothetical protein [Xanthovirga aplysinae]|uniref:hypothetical protein n=1 Tax=Xanthovirga aplysinae TaxID=2529853 RepID=UPI0012BBF060|nr:hypothetical protein [Xanthovirga aplysinae]MTI29765.1 hypothetical protein [Xanthovirga aplysinae]